MRFIDVRERFSKQFTKKGYIKKKAQQRAIFPSSPDIVATVVLNFCVRDGNRCDHHAKATRLFSLERSMFSENRILSLHALQVTVFTFAPDLAYSFIKYELVKLSDRILVLLS